MIGKFTKINTADTSGALYGRCIQIYQNLPKKNTTKNKFIKVSIIQTWIQTTHLKGRLYKGIIIRTKYGKTNYDGTVFKFPLNSCVLLKKRLTSVGKFIKGPGVYSIKRKKFLTSFMFII